jgi:hypothetical protein
LSAAVGVLCLGYATVNAWVNTPCCHYDWHLVADAELSAGYRQDNLHWSIADPSGTPNILSELQWKNIQIAEVKGEARVLWIDLIYLRGSASYGRIFHGNNRDSDYAGDDKTLEFSRTKAKSDKGEVFDFSGGIGWQFEFPLWCSCLRLIPMFGYSYSEQHLRDRDGEILINSAFSELGDEIPLGPLGPFPGLHSNYRAKWRGAWLGVDAFYRLDCNVELFGTFEYHRLKYHGTGHWNLRTDFVSDFQHKAKHGHGFYASGGFKYLICTNMYAGLTGSYRWMNSRHGTDTTYFVLGPETTRFNGTTWHSWSILINAGYLF